MIRTRNLSVSLGRTQILAGIDFVARAGEVTVIVGPNGSGKSTFLKALSGEIAASGEIALNGTPLGTFAPWQAAAVRAVLPQATALAFPFTVHEIVRLGVTAGQGARRPVDPSGMIGLALARVDLDGFAGRLYQELSGGEQQRVHLARVLCQVWEPVVDGEPRWLLLDEPVSALDIRHQLLVMDVARDFAARGGGVIAVLHDLNLMAMCADAACAMHRGRIVAAGTPRTILTDALMADVFGCRLRVGAIPADGAPFVLPQTARRAGGEHGEDAPPAGDGVPPGG